VRPEPGQARQPAPAHPSHDRCHPACANISRTDSHTEHIQAEINRIEAEITDGLAPHPIQQRLRQRQSTLEQIIAGHKATRIRPSTDPGTRQ